MAVTCDCIRILRCETYRLGITNWLAGTSAKSSSIDNRRPAADGGLTTTFASIGVDVIGGFVMMLLAVVVSILSIVFVVLDVPGRGCSATNPGRDSEAVPVRYFRFLYIFAHKYFWNAALEYRSHRSTDFWFANLFSVTVESMARARHSFYVFENVAGDDGLEFVIVFGLSLIVHCLVMKTNFE